MKKTIAALLAFICIVGGSKAVSVSPKYINNGTAITAHAADATDLSAGVNAKSYKFKYADTSLYDITSSKVRISGKNIDSKNYTWTDSKSGNTYGFIKTIIKDKNNNSIVENGEFITLAIISAKATNLDVVVSQEIDIPEYTVEEKFSTALDLDFEKKFKGKTKGTVTSIFDGAFADSYIKSVDLTNIEYIGANAFKNAKYITDVVIPDTVKFVGASSFEGSGLKTLAVNNDMPIIPKKFCMGTNLTDVKFKNPQFIREIGESSFQNTPLAAPIFDDWSDTSKFETVKVQKAAFSGCTSIKKINCPDNITYFGISAFENCTSVTDLKFGKKLLAADQSCFKGNTSLKNITFNTVVHSLAGGCFQGCTSLEKVTGLPATLLDWTPEDENLGVGVGQGTFADCTSLQEITLPKSLTRIPGKMFENCTKLTKLQFGNPGDTPVTTGKGILKVKEAAFKNCTSMKGFDFPDTKIIEKNAFTNCTAMTSFKVGECDIVGDNALEGCTAMTEITLLSNQYGGDANSNNDPSKTNSTHGYVFKNCTAAKKINIKTDGAVKLSSGMFSGCTNLKEIGADVSKISVIGKDCFSDCTSLVKLNLPALRIIEANGFKNCSLLTSISDSGNAIKCEDYGDSCFLNCSKLNITVTGDISTIGVRAFENSAVKSVSINGMVGGTVVIGASAFAKCQLLTDATINSEGVQKFSVGNAIFDGCPVLSKVVYEGPIITDYMFRDCTNLASLETSADNFGTGAFKNCGKLKQVNKKGTTEAVIAKTIKGEAFANCASLVNASSDLNTVFSGTSQYMGCSSLKAATVPTLTNYMFKNCTNLADVAISTDVEVVPDQCFLNCENLKKFDFSNIKEIKSTAFQNTGFESLDFNVQSVGTGAFSQCQNLKNIKVAAPKIASNSFASCPLLKDAIVKTASVPASMFNGDSSLEKVTMQSDDDITLTSINNAFGGCTSLGGVVIYGNPTIADNSIGIINRKAVPGFVIAGQKGSTAEEYANSKEIKFVEIGGSVVITAVTTTTTTTTTKTTTTTTKTTSKTTASTTKSTSKPTSSTTSTTSKQGSSTSGTTASTPKVTVSGDSNCDGKVDLSDAVLIMQSICNPSKFGTQGTEKNKMTAQGWANSDCCNPGDGVTNADALAIQKYKLSLIKSLPEKTK